MDIQFQMLFDQMKLEMHKQTIELRETITKNIMDRIEGKLTPIIEENVKLKQVSKLEKEVEYLKREKKSNNIIIFGLDEKEKSTSELLRGIQKIF